MPKSFFGEWDFLKLLGLGGMSKEFEFSICLGRTQIEGKGIENLHFQLGRESNFEPEIYFSEKST